MRSAPSLVIVLLQFALARAGENWPQFRGPEGNGVSDARGLPLRWSETENIKWKTAIHGRAWSSPVIWGNQVWMTTATEDGIELVCRLRRPRHRQGVARHPPVPQREAAVHRPDEQLRLAHAVDRKRPILRQFRLLRNRLRRYGHGRHRLEPPRLPLRPRRRAGLVARDGRQSAHPANGRPTTNSTSLHSTRRPATRSGRRIARPTTETAAPSSARRSARRW